MLRLQQQLNCTVKKQIKRIKKAHDIKKHSKFIMTLGNEVRKFINNYTNKNGSLKKNYNQAESSFFPKIQELEESKIKSISTKKENKRNIENQKI